MGNFIGCLLPPPGDLTPEPTYVMAGEKLLLNIEIYAGFVNEGRRIRSKARRLVVWIWSCREPNLTKNEKDRITKFVNDLEEETSPLRETYLGTGHFPPDGNSVSAQVKIYRHNTRLRELCSWLDKAARRTQRKVPLVADYIGGFDESVSPRRYKHWILVSAPVNPTS